MRMKSAILFLVLLLSSSITQADKVIMKDGKIYEGHIMGETARSVLIRLAHSEEKPIFLNMHDVQTLVRESHGPEIPSPEAGRFAQVDVLATGSLFSSRTLDFGWAPGLTFNGGFRLHPALEIGGGINWWPGLSGTIGVRDERSGTIRGYDHFYAYSGGFHAKVFPFFSNPFARFEPYVMGGYFWNRVVPKGSEDYFSGTSWFLGVGNSWRWTRSISIETRLQYVRTQFDTIKFQSGQGDLSGVHQSGVSLGLGLAYRFL